MPGARSVFGDFRRSSRGPFLTALAPQPEPAAHGRSSSAHGTGLGTSRPSGEGGGEGAWAAPVGRASSRVHGGGRALTHLSRSRPWAAQSRGDATISVS